MYTTCWLPTRKISPEITGVGFDHGPIYYVLFYMILHWG